MTNFRFQPTRPLRGATSLDDLFANFDVISTHAPLAGRDRKSHSTSYVPPVFQPTRPLRGATDWSYLVICLYSDFNPRAPCGARPPSVTGVHNYFISTHAPLAGRDSPYSVSLLYRYDFNPRAPCGARRAPPRGILAVENISTHAPLAGRDVSIISPYKTLKNFNPRAPCGARPSQRPRRTKPTSISTHAPLAGRD